MGTQSQTQSRPRFRTVARPPQRQRRRLLRHDQRSGDGHFQTGAYRIHERQGEPRQDPQQRYRTVAARERAATQTHESEPLPQSEPQPQPDRRDQRLPEKQERRERSQRHLVASGRLLRRRRVDDGTQSDALGGNQSGQRQGGLHRPRRQSHLRIRLPRQVRRGRHDPRRTRDRSDSR